MAQTNGQPGTLRLIFTRDNILWTIVTVVSTAAGVITTLAGSLELFPWISDKWKHAILLTSFLIGVSSAKMGWSSLASRAEVKQQAVADQVAKDTGVPAVVVATTTTAAVGNPPASGGG